MTTECLLEFRYYKDRLKTNYLVDIVRRRRYVKDIWQYDRKGLSSERIQDLIFQGASGCPKFSIKDQGGDCQGERTVSTKL